MESAKSILNQIFSILREQPINQGESAHEAQEKLNRIVPLLVKLKKLL
jgi:hypothetical protein